MKLDCEVIRDLLPLYAEHMASPASTALVKSICRNAKPAAPSWSRCSCRCRCSRNPSRMPR